MISDSYIVFIQQKISRESVKSVAFFADFL